MDGLTARRGLFTEVKLKAVGDAEAVGKAADEAVLRLNGLFDDFESISRGGQTGGMAEFEHGQIVEVVADGKHVFGPYFMQARYLREGGSFVVIGMAKPGVNVVAHDLEVGDFPAILLHVLVDGLGVGVVEGGQAERGIGVLGDFGIVTGADPAQEPGQVFADLDEQFLVGPAAGVVPIGMADVAGVLAAVDFAFDDDDVIWADGDVGAHQAVEEEGEVAAGVDDPEDAAFLEAADEFLEGHGDGRVFILGEQGAVEVG